MIIVKILIGAMLVFMVFNLFKAMKIMLKGESSEPMSKFIGRRVLASALIIGVILLAVALGLVSPNPRPY